MPRTAWLALLFAACSHTTSPPAAAPAASVETGDPLPDHGGGTIACEAADAFRWLATDPRVPLARTDGEGVHEALDCCAAWAHTGDRFTAVDAWGAPIAEATIVGGEGYDVTQCYELTFDGLESEEALAAGADRSLLVRGPRPWQAPPSAQWQPSPAERDALYRVVGGLGALAPVPGSDGVAAIESGAAFFQLAGDDRDPSAPTHFAAVAGRALAIFAVAADGTWHLSYIDASAALGGPRTANPYTLIAVFDMDGDGFPEVIAHRNDGPSWDDVILGCAHDATARTWHEIAASIGGGTA